MRVSDVTLCYKSKPNPTHHLNCGMNITSMSGALRKTNNPRRLTNGWRINKMAKRQRPDYGKMDSRILQATRTNWQDIKHPIDNVRLDWVRSEHKRSVYVKEMREEWFNNQRKQDQKALLLRELGKLSELF